MFEVTLMPILVAAIGNVIIGFIWYHPKVFGTAWMAGAGITPEKAEMGKKRMPYMALLGALVAMLIAYVMNHFGIAWGVFDWIGGVELAFWIWLGFFVPALIGSVLWEQKPLKYFVINASYWLVSLIMMGVVLVQLAA